MRLRNSSSYLYEAKAVVEAFDGIVYKHTHSSQSIKLMKLAKRKVTPLQAIKLTCALELEVKTLKARPSPHGKDSNTAFTLPLETEPEWFRAKNCTVLAAYWFQYGDWAMIFRGRGLGTRLVGKRNAQEGTKTHEMQLHSRMSQDIALTRFWDWNALVQYLAWHGCSTDLAWYCLHWQVRRYQTGLAPCQLALSKRAGPAWHNLARRWHTLVMFTLPLLIVPNCAGTVLARFQVAV